MLNLHPDSQGRASCSYALANQNLDSTIEFTRLARFKVDTPSASRLNPSDFHALATTNPAWLRYAGEAPFAGRQRLIELYVDGHRARIVVDGANAYRIDSAKRIAVCCLPDPASDLALELLLGPVAVLFFQCANQYLLHAACVQTPVGAIALVAESGVGKSTLSTSADQDWQQLTDDVLVIEADSFSIATNFPQLKLPHAIAPAAEQAQAESKRLAGIIRLSPQARDEITVTKVQAPKALLQIVRHTVGAKLFDAEQLQQHMHFAQHLAQECPMWECGYPREMGRLDEVRKHIIAAVGG